MEVLPSCTHYKETRINLDWISKSTTTILIPSPSSPDHHYVLAEPEPQLSTADEDIEGAFRSAHIATSTNTFFRPLNRFPRAILWRITDDSHTLTLNSVDFVRPDTSRIDQTIRLRFHAPIKEQCVALADGGDVDETVVYVLLSDKTVYTLRLKPDFWKSESARKRLPDWCRWYCPSTFTLNSPHLLVALDSESAVVALQNGGLLKLTKNRETWVDADGTMETKYYETSYNNSIMSTFKQFLMPFSHSSVAAGTIISLTQWDGLNDEDSEEEPLRYVLSVSVNRALKVWSPEHASPLWEGNILNEPKGSPILNELLESTPRQLVKIISKETELNLFYAITLDPETNSFKIWSARKNSRGEFSKLHDEFPEADLTPTPPKRGAQWEIHDFAVEEKEDTGTYNFWVLWKRHGHSKVHCHELDFSELTEKFDQYTVVSQERLQDFPVVDAGNYTVGSQDVGDFWEEWILFPERFPESVIETVLKVYAKRYPAAREQAYATGALPSRIASTVVACHQEPVDDDSMDVDARSGLAAHWERFAKLCSELDRERQAPMKLALDPYSHFLWVVYADGMNSIRECLELEYILENQSVFVEEPERVISGFVETPNPDRKKLSSSRTKDVMWLIYAASKLSQAWTAQDRQDFRMFLEEYVNQDPMFATIDRVETLYSKAIDGRFSLEFLAELGAILDNISDVFATFGRLYYFFRERGTAQNEAHLTPFGEKVLIKAAQEAIHIDTNTLVNVFSLFVLICCSADSLPLANEPKHPASALAEFLELYFNKVREYELLTWMSKRKLAETLDEDSEDALTNVLNDLSVSDSSIIPAEKKNCPILQLLLQEQMGPTLTGAYGSNVAPYARSFISYLHSQTYDTIAVDTATFLLNFQAYDLAKSFLRFVPTTHWGTYIKGRIHLATDDDEVAAVTFRRAASGLANQQVQSTLAPGPIQAIIGDDASLFGTGFACYYYHVARLFLKRKNYPYVLEFTQLALDTLHIPTHDTVLDAKKMSELEGPLLRVLFNAAQKTSTFPVAYLAAARMRDPETQKAAIGALVKDMVEQGQAQQLISFSFTGLQTLLEEVLEKKCEEVVDIKNEPAYHKVLYAWLVKKGDFKGAANALYSRLTKLKTAEAGLRDPRERTITDGQLVLLNAMHCLERDNAWVFGTERSKEGEVEGENGRLVPGGKRVRREGGDAANERVVVKVEDVYREYREERERNRMLARGRFYLD